MPEALVLQDNFLVRLVKRLYERLTRPSPEKVAEILQTVERHAEVTRKYEENRAKWAGVLAHPAHEYLAIKLAEAGLPENVANVAGKVCTFWATRNTDTYFFWGTPCAATVIGVRVFAEPLQLDVSSGPTGRPCTLYFYKEAGWTLRVSDAEYKLDQFQIL